MNTKKNIGSEIAKQGILLDLNTSELMVIWSLRHSVNCAITGENPKDLFKLCFEQHQLPDISALIDEVVYGIGEGTDDKGPIGSELCDHVHYGILKEEWNNRKDKLKMFLNHITIHSLSFSTVITLIILYLSEHTNSSPTFVQ